MRSQMPARRAWRPVCAAPLASCLRLSPLFALAIAWLPVTTHDAAVVTDIEIVRVDSELELDDLISASGDQVVIVPDGVYEGLTVEAPHPETDGPLDGWLVLVAQTPHGVVVTGDLTLEAGTSRVMFVGFRFDKARVFNFGKQIRYWYTDHVYPDVDWYAADRPIPRQFFLRNPATDVGVYGGDFHDGVASPINLSGVDRIEFVGVKVYDLSEPEGSDPEDRSHLNSISLLGGDVTDLMVRSSSFEGARANHQTDAGDVSGIHYDDVWYRGAFGAAFQFNSTNGFRISDSRRTNVRSWDHVGVNPRDRLDIIDGTQFEPGERPDRVDVIDVEISENAPLAGEADPATRWRRQNPYGSWSTYFGWPEVEPVDAPSDGSSDGSISPVILPTVAVGVVLALFALSRTLRGRAS